MVKITAVAAMALVAAATPVLSTVVITKPVASTNGSGGKSLEVEWNDDGKAPTSSTWGSINIYLATGSHDVQYKLQTLDTNVAYSKGSGSYKIDADSGPDGGFYFLRFEGTGAGTPPMAFSARFSLSDMEGNFNSTVMSELSGAGGTASAGGSAATVTSASASASASASKSASTTSLVRSTSTMTVSASAARSSGTTNTSSATRTQFAGLASALVGFAAFATAFL